MLPPPGISDLCPSIPSATPQRTCYLLMKHQQCAAFQKLPAMLIVARANSKRIYLSNSKDYLLELLKVKIR